MMHITPSLVGVAMTMTVIQPISEILVVQLVIQMIMKITVIAAFYM